MNTINEIHKIGLDTFITKYNLKSRDYGHKFNLKYDQLNTPRNPSTDECRGLILSKDLSILSYPFTRFSNYDETSRKTIDWESVTYWEKSDGSMIQYYYDPIIDKWSVGTTGTAEAVDLVSCRDKITQEVNRYDFNLSDLFFKYNLDLTHCIKGNTYIFELVTQFNKVINKYDNDKVVLLGVRNNTTLNESDQDYLTELSRVIGCERPRQYFFNSEKEMLDSLKNVKYGDDNFEGYVVVDKNFKRLKVKSNTYIIYSQFNGDIESKWRLVDVVLSNEIDEVVSSFPELKTQLYQMRSNYNRIIKPVKEKFDSLKIGVFERKDFFIEGSKSINFDKSKKCLLSIFTELFNTRNITFEEALEQVNKKSLYKIIK